MSHPYQILYRDSSTSDGVQSRGASWHSREVQEKNETQRLERLTGELAEGDLVRLPGKAGKLYAHDGQALRAVEPLSGVPEDHDTDASWKLARRSKGDWISFWEASEDAADLLWLVPARDECWGLLVGGACDLAETVLRFIPPGEERPRRVLRMTRLWLAGAMTARAVEAVAAHARTLASTFPSIYVSATAAASRASVHASSVCSVSSAHFEARAAAFACAQAHASALASAQTSVTRSLAFLVRTRLPVWKVCLAVAREGT